MITCSALQPAVTDVVHGGAQIRELRGLGLTPDDVIDFSASINPYGPAPAARAALKGARLDRYPDPHATLLVEALSQHLDIPTEWIIPGNGASELLRAAAHTWASDGRTILTVRPSFGEYAGAAAAVGARLVEHPLDADDGFRLDVDCLVELISEHQPALIYLCNPNNPTGELLSGTQVERLVTAAATGTVILDEAYLSFVPNSWSALELLQRTSNLVLVRSMTKDYALTALRLGYAIGRPERIDRLRRSLPSWNVNGLAQAAGVAALGDQAYLRATIARVARAKDQLVRALRSLGLDPIAGAANFVLVEVGDAVEVRRQLLEQRLLVRDCVSFGLPGHVRIGVRRPEEQRRLLHALDQVLPTGSRSQNKYNSRHRGTRRTGG